MHFSLCNEMFEGRPFAEVCATAARLGYHGIEIAPFTFAERVEGIAAETRHEVKRAAADHGLAIVGLHWLLAGTSGLHMTSPDRGVRERTREYFHRLIELCGDLGGKVMVIGSPQQRSLAEEQSFEDAWGRAAELFASVLEDAAERGVTLCIEPLSPAETDFINTAQEGRRMVHELDSPSFRLHLDVKAMSAEPRPVPEILRELDLSDVGHFHVNDPNLYGPGMGEVDYAPIAAAIDRLGWDRWLSVEVFRYDPDGETIARKSLECLRRFWPDS